MTATFSFSQKSGWLKSKILGKPIQYRHLSEGKGWGYDGEVEKKKDDNYFVRLRLQESKTPRKCIPLPLDLRHLPKLGQNASKYVDLGLCSICDRSIQSILQVAKVLKALQIAFRLLIILVSLEHFQVIHRRLLPQAMLRRPIQLLIFCTWRNQAVPQL